MSSSTHEARIRDIRNAYNIFNINLVDMRKLVTPRHREDDITTRTDLKETRRNDVHWICLLQGGPGANSG
jgi:hypothetical protein